MKKVFYTDRAEFLVKEFIANMLKIFGFKKEGKTAEVLMMTFSYSVLCSDFEFMLSSLRISNFSSRCQMLNNVAEILRLCKITCKKIHMAVIGTPPPLSLRSHNVNFPCLFS